MNTRSFNGLFGPLRGDLRGRSKAQSIASQFVFTGKNANRVFVVPNSVSSAQQTYREKFYPEDERKYLATDIPVRDPDPSFVPSHRISYDEVETFKK